MSLSATTLVAGGILFTTVLFGTTSHIPGVAAIDVVGQLADDGAAVLVEDSFDRIGDEVDDTAAQSDSNDRHKAQKEDRPHFGKRHHRRHRKSDQEGGSDKDAQGNNKGEVPPPLRGKGKGRHNGKGHKRREDKAQIFAEVENIAIQPAQQQEEQKTTKRFEVSFERLLQSPVLTNAFSSSTFNYNSAYVPHVGTDSHDSLPRDCLAVRVQNYTATGSGSRYSSARSSLSPSAMLSHAKKLFGKKTTEEESVRKEPFVGAGYIGPSSISIICEDSYDYPFSKENTWVVLEPSQASYQALGTEDPRVVYLPKSLETDELKLRREEVSNNKNEGTPQPNPKEGTLLMYYTAVNNQTSDGHVTAMLSLALCHLSVDPHCTSWELRGPIIKDRAWSKSGAMLVVPDKPNALPTEEPKIHYLLFGDSNIFVATTTDFLTYNDTGVPLMTTRADPLFDSNLIEAGPPPELLADNESFIFLYNSARTVNIPNPDPNWNLEYNLGYAILGLPTETFAQAIPTVIQRSDVPILSPELGWETCNNASGVPGLTADVVFVEGMKRLKKSKNGNTDLFLVYYQGADARMGMGLLTVDMIVE